MAPMCTPFNTCIRGPTRVRNPNGISIGSAIFAKLTAECRRACQGMSFPIKIAPLLGGDLDPHLTHGSMGQPESTTQTASRSVEPFCRARYFDRQTDRMNDRPLYSVGDNRPQYVILRCGRVLIVMSKQLSKIVNKTPQSFKCSRYDLLKVDRWRMGDSS